MKKKVMTLCMTVLMVTLTAGVFTVHADAASRDVTAKMSKDKNLKRITRMMTAYTTAMNISGPAQKKTTNIKLNSSNRLSIAAFVRFQYKEDVGFTANELKAETKALFGKGTGAGQIKAYGKTSMLVCNSNRYVKEPYMYCGGEFGDNIPLYKITRIRQIGKNTYQVTAQNRLGIYGEKGSEKIGTTTLILKKAAASRYGYIVKNIAYK